MPSFVPHLVVPLLLALALLPMARRQIILWSPIAWAPDFDYLMPGLHRAATSSIFIPIVLAAAVVWLWRRRDPSAGLLEFATRPGAPGGLLLSAYYVTSHIMMDIFAGGVVLFWPLWTRTFFLSFTILVDTGTNELQPHGDGGSAAGVPEISPVFPWLSAVDTAVVVFLALALLAWLLLRRPVVTVRRKVHDSTPE